MGTPYLKYEPSVFTGFAIKSDSIMDTHDFFDRPFFVFIEGDQTGAGLDVELETNQKSFSFDHNIVCRDGMFEHNQLFAVFEKQDIEAMIELMQHCLKSIKI